MRKIIETDIPTSNSVNVGNRPYLQGLRNYRAYLRQGGYVFRFVCLFVSRITQKLINRFHKIQRKVRTWTRKKPSDFGGNLAV